MSIPDDQDCTLDYPAEGVCVAQPKRGFRYGSEAFWLTGFALESAPMPARVLDLGTGSGIMALLLARTGVSVLGVDIRREWASFWTQTLSNSDVSGEVVLRVHDVAEGPPAVGVDLVVSNPPFFPRATGPESMEEWKAAARTESSATLASFIEVGMACLAPLGRACWVVPRERWEEVSFPGVARTRVVHVGHRRSLVELSLDPHAKSGEPMEVSDRGLDVERWYALACGAMGRSISRSS